MYFLGFSTPEQGAKFKTPVAHTRLLKVDRARLIFGSEIFDFLIFFGFGKDSLTFLGLEIFNFLSWVNNYDAIYCFGCPIKRS